MKKYHNFLSENFNFLEEKFSIYLNRRIFVMTGYSFLCIIVHILVSWKIEFCLCRPYGAYAVFYGENALMSSETEIPNFVLSVFFVTKTDTPFFVLSLLFFFKSNFKDFIRYFN